MRLLLSIVSFCLVLIIFSTKIKRNDGLQDIKVFYDSLCPDAINFINGPYKSFYSIKYLQNRLKVILIPGALMSFETNNDSQETYFSCFGGENECLGNIFHSCAIYLLDIEQANKYIICYMDNIVRFKKNNFQTTSFCAKEVGFKEETLFNCASSPAGVNFMKLLLRRKQGTMTHSPWIIVNGQYDKKKEDLVLENTTAYACKMINDLSLPICNSYSQFLSYK